MVDLGSIEALRIDAVRRGPAMLLRSGVVDRLVAAQSLLPRRLRLVIVEAHAFVDHCTPPDWAAHRTGAAVDIALGVAGDGTPLPSTDLRLLGAALHALGFVNAHPASWHWSYGDVDWAKATGARVACYGPVHAP